MIVVIHEQQDKVVCCVNIDRRVAAIHSACYGAASKIQVGTTSAGNIPDLMAI